MKRLQSCLIAIYLLAFSLSSAYAEDDFINEITKLYNAGQIAEAYELAEKYLLEAEGDPAFDYLYGLAAIDSGHISQGVFALERILMLRPNDQRVRLELARGYFLLEQYNRAHQEFTKVLDLDPPADVKVNINRFMDAIRLREAGYKTTAGMYVELGLGYDSNANSSPSAANFASAALGPGTLSDSSLSTSDSYQSLAVGVDINHPITADVSLFGNVNINQLSYEDAPEFNVGSFNAEVGFVFPGEKSRLQLGLQWQNFEVGHDRYRELLGINGDWRWQLNDKTMLTAFFQLADMEFLTDHLRDSWQQMGGIGFQRLFLGTLQPLLSFTLYGGAERSRGDLVVAEALVDRDIYGLSIGMQFTINSKLTLNFNAMAQESRYRWDDSFFLIQREDEYRNISFAATWKPDQCWAIRTNLIYTENDSNIAINRYYRTQAGMTVRYEY